MENRKQERARRFVTAILERCREDKGFAARLRRADNPDTEHYAYGALASFGIALEDDEERRPHAVIAAGLSRSGREQDGSLGLGEALRRCVESEEQGEARLRRMLACRTTEEVCRMLRPLLSFIAARDAPLCHARLLDDLLSFRFEDGRRRVCLRWAQEYYGRSASDADGQAGEGDA
ncbi:type I-E CRISPR-associated protein Cse2/CasB [Desulfovibrio piger]|nr:type I-E CRISPR-associated protein Cse2/CasB [Desulfovibrio piger]